MAQGKTRLQLSRERNEALKNERLRSGFFGQWRDLANYILPRHGRFLIDRANDGTPKQTYILDPTASHSARILGSGLMSGVTNPARPWFRLATADPDLSEYGPVKEYLYQVQRRMEVIFARSNLYNVLPSVYESLGTFGTSCMLSFEDFDDLVLFQDLPIGSYCLATDAKGRVNAAYRERQYTVAQLVGEFGLANVSRSTRSAWERNNFDHWINTVHLIEPNDNREPRSPFAQDMPVRSLWFEEGATEEDGFLRASGFEEFPAFCPRWYVNGEDVYGHSVGMEALPDVKQLQFERRMKSIGIEKMANPPMVGHPNMKTEAKNTLPGGVSYSPTPDGFRPAYQVDPKLGDLREDIEDVRAQIRAAYFEDLFLMLEGIDRAQITAYEIAQRKEEKLLMLGPVLQRINDDLLKPLIDRVFAMGNRVTDALGRSVIFPEPPEELQGQELKVEFISVLHQAQRAVGNAALQQFRAEVTALAQVNPAVLDKVDFDQWIDEYGENSGLPPRVIRSDEDVEKVRADRAQREAMERAAQMAPPVAQAAKDASETDLGGDTGLTRVLSAVGLQ